MTEREVAPERALAVGALREHGDAVYRAALGAAGNEADALDATQEVFLSVLRRPDALAGVERVRNWLQRAALHAVWKQRRAAGARSRREEQVVGARSEAVSSPDEVEREDERRALREQVARLPEDLRLAVVLHSFGGQSYEEVGALLECSPGTVGSRLTRARERLRAGLVRTGAVAPAGLDLDALLARTGLGLPPGAAARLEGLLLRAPLGPATPTAPTAPRSPGGVVQALLAVALVAALGGGARAVLRADEPAPPRVGGGVGAAVSHGALASSPRPRGPAVTPGSDRAPEPMTGGAATPSGDAGAAPAGLRVHVVANQLCPGVAGVLVDVSPIGSAGAPLLTDEQGRARFASVAAVGTYRVTVRAPGFKGFLIRAWGQTWGAERWALASVEEGSEVLLRLEESDPPWLEVVLLHPDLRISGRVLDPAGAPIQGARVQWSPGGDAGTRTDADGRFVLEETLIGEVEVTASHPRWAWASATVPLTATRRHAELELTLAEPAALTGALLEEEGRPVAAGRVEVVPHVPGRTPAAGYDVLLRGQGVSVEVEPDGSFRVDGLRPGQVDVLGVVPGHTVALARGVLVRPGAPTHVELRARRGGTLTGRFVDSAGRPVTVDGSVHYHPPGGAGDRRQVLARGGEFTLVGLDAPAYDVSVWPDAPYGRVHFENVAVAAPLQVTLHRTAEVQVRLVTPAGGHAPWRTRYELSAGQGWPITHSAHPEADGSFILHFVPWTTTRLELELEGYERVAFDLALEEGATVSLSADLVLDPRRSPAPDLDDPQALADSLRAAGPRTARALMERVHGEATRGSRGSRSSCKSPRPDLLAVVDVALDHPDAEVRSMAVGTLARMDLVEGLPLLERCLTHEDPSVRLGATVGLGCLLDDPPVRPRVIALLQRVSGDPAEALRGRLIAASDLVHAGVSTDPRLFVDVLRLTARLDPALPARNEVELAAGALVRLGRKDALGLMVARLQTADSLDASWLSEALEELTGQALGLGYPAWREWLDSHRAELPPQLP